MAEVEGALGKEAEELLEPLRLLASSHRRAGRLDDAYTVMMRAMTLCEKHHGEEGLVTCKMRILMGEPCLPHCGMLCGPYVATNAPLTFCISHSSSTRPSLILPLFKGDLFDDMGNYASALQQHDRVLSVYLRELPADHPDLISAMGYL